MAATTSRPRIVDCLVIGGGPAGLAAAIQLGRLHRSCVVVDDDAGRSLWSQVTRNHLGFPGGVSAADLRLLGQRQAVAHDVELRRGRVVRLRRDRGGDGFRAVIEPADDTAGEDEDAPGLPANRERERRVAARLGERRTRPGTTIRARAVLLATGVIDAFPAFEGRDECVGVSLFWCIVCDGYEATGRQVAVVGDDEDAISTAFGLLHFTDRVVLVTGRSRARAPGHRLDALADRGVVVHRAAVASYAHGGGRIERLTLAGGHEVVCEMVFVSVPQRPRTQLATRLGAERDGSGYLVVDADGRTTVPGLYAAGDATAGHSHQVTTAAHLGATAATAVNYDAYDAVERGEA